jgi:hypothetical protein
MIEDDHTEQTKSIKPPKQGKMFKKTRNGKRVGRQRLPLSERKTVPKKEVVLEKKTRKHRIEDSDLVSRSIMGLAKMGKTMDEIADFVGVSKSWLEKNYKHQIRCGREMANALVVENLYQQAMKDSPSSIQAGIYLTKARMGWKDKPDEEGNKAPAVVFDFSGLDYDERVRLMERIKLRKGNHLDDEVPTIDGEVVEDEQ